MQDYPRMIAAETVAESLPPGACSLVSKLGRVVYNFRDPIQEHAFFLPDHMSHSLPGSLGAHSVSVTMLQRCAEQYYFHSGLLLELDMSIVTREKQAPSQWLGIERLDPSEGDSMEMLEPSNIYICADGVHVSGPKWQQCHVTRRSRPPSTVHLTCLIMLMLELAIDHPYSAWGHNCNWWASFVYEQILRAMGQSFTPAPAGKNLPGPSLDFKPQRSLQMPDL